MYRANVNGLDNFYWTPLHMAAHSGVRAVVEYLLDHGASLEARSLTGATPIMKAIETCSLDVVQLLINRGAKVTAENMSSKCRIVACLLRIHRPVSAHAVKTVISGYSYDSTSLRLQYDRPATIREPTLRP